MWDRFASDDSNFDDCLLPLRLKRAPEIIEMKRLLIAIIFFVAAVSLSQFLLPPSEAATFYVALTGSDTAGSGSSSNPWRTIDHAITHVPDGSGRSTVSYGVEPNTTGQARKGTITVNGRVVTIKQMW
jgi:hypothetical protein